VKRYQQAFERADRLGELLFIPFTLLGYPTLELSERFIEVMIRHGADALELGIPFSDPIADGPVIQAAGTAALAQGVTPLACLALVARIREKYPEVPIGLLLYANLLESVGRHRFFELLRLSGVDSVLFADVPHHELAPYREVAAAHEVALVQMIAPNTPPELARHIAKMSQGYTYVVTRFGVTGEQPSPKGGLKGQDVMGAFLPSGAAPPVAGFGIGRPKDVVAYRDMGMKGVISGSAIVRIIGEITQDPHAVDDQPLAKFIEEMKASTKCQGGIIPK
jgi:tryptophan synthase alpha chain